MKTSWRLYFLGGKVAYSHCLLKSSLDEGCRLVILEGSNDAAQEAIFLARPNSHYHILQLKTCEVKEYVCST